ncbi:Por secretion system C-terminal sorting domain-containing protein [Chitinophaga sp. CF118]|nr:Por secretion system C-terminal sorting domain-containing protein [Chitinophaga sp. CF118]
MLYPFRGQAQGDQTKITVKLATGVTTGAWLHLPDDYSSTTTSYPLIIFIHGVGEAGTNVNDVLLHGLPKIISKGAKMQFTVGGKLFKFITVSPQITNGWASADMIQSILDDVKSRYRIDASRIYLTGLSAGGYGTLNYVASGTNYSNNLAAIVPVSSAAIDAAKVPGLCNVASSNIASWFLIGSGDSFLDIQKNYVTKINGCSPKYPALSTIYTGGTHSDNVWDKAYDATHTYQSPNIYEWMLQYSKGGTTVVPAPVAAVAAENISITLPVNSTTLDGSSSTASGSSIASYAWNLVSGPSTPTFSSTSVAKITVSNLIAGTYVFNLTVKNTEGTSSTKQVTVVVSAATSSAPVAAIVYSNIKLPVNSTTLDGSTSTASGSTIASYAWSLVSGPSTPTFSSTTTAKITVSNLVAGSYVFNLTVKNTAGTTGTKQATVVVSAATNGTTTACNYCKFLITPGTDGGAYINGTTLGVQPGDTVCVQAGNYKYIQFFNFTGTTAKPIVFINCGGQVKAGNGGSYGFIFNNAKYFKVTGSGSTDKYGFSIDGVNIKLNVGMAMGKGCTDYEAERVEIAGSEVGLMAKVNPDCETANQYPYFAIRNVKLHDLYIHDVIGEGMYVGNTAPNGTEVTCADGTVKNVLPPRIYNLKIYNVITANTGWDGIQVASAPENVEIYNNNVSNYGIENKGSQQAGIILGGETNGKVYNNIVVKGTGNGIEIFGMGLCYVYNNIVSDAGWDGTTVRQDAIFADDRPTKNNYVPLQLYAFNNTVVNSGRDAIRMQNSYGTVASGNLFYNNLLVSPGSLATRAALSYLSLDKGIVNTTSNNLNIPDIATAKFANATGKNFHLAAGSPAIDKGKDLSAYFKIDFDGEVRPQGAAFDIGADEYGSGTVANIAPIAAAGTDASITLPVATVTLDGSGSSDSDGSIASYAWAQVSGPVTATFSSATVTNPVISKLTTAGTYVFKLTVIDDKGASATDQVTITVKAAAVTNVAPVTNAGSNETITLPVSQATLSGSATDADGTIASYAWTQVSGPVTATISSATITNPVVSKLTAAGTYIFKLTATDNDGATAAAQVSVIVNAAANVAPVANAGSNETITLPVSQATLSGSATDADGTIASYAWTQVSGPVTATISSTTITSPVVSKLTTAGTYIFKLTATDNDGATDAAQVSVIVNAADNEIPVATAGSNETITLPVSQATLNGSATDPDGTIASVAWAQVSGPVTATISSATITDPVVSKLTTAGTYIFKLTAKDNDGAMASAQVSVIVNAPAAPTNKAPIANAGNDITITQPMNNSAVTAAASADSDGNIISYKWSQVSGPSTASIVSPTAVKSDLNKLTEVGTYVFRLTVTDNGGTTGTDDISVIVKPNPANQLYANAGADQTIAFPTINMVTLDGAGSYATNDGYVSYYSWSKVSGPAGETILNNAAMQPIVTFTTAGTYVFRLKVTDTYNNTATDDVTIIVGSKTGVVTQSLSTIKLYPNPVVSTLTLKLTLATETDIIVNIFNSNGVANGTYYLGPITTIQKDINVSNLVSGTYLLQVTDGKTMNLTSKFIKN